MPKTYACAWAHTSVTSPYSTAMALLSTLKYFILQCKYKSKTAFVRNGTSHHLHVLGTGGQHYTFLTSVIHGGRYGQFHYLTSLFHKVFWLQLKVTTLLSGITQNMTEHRTDMKRQPHKFGSKRYVQTINKEIQSQYYGVHSSISNMQTNNATKKELWKHAKLTVLM